MENQIYIPESAEDSVGSGERGEEMSVPACT